MASWQAKVLKTTLEVSRLARSNELGPLRKWFALSARGRIPADVRHEPVDAGGAAAEWVRVESRSSDETESIDVVLYAHGGGFSVGSSATHREFVGRLGREIGCDMLSVDYRLAPEHPFPAGRWMTCEQPGFGCWSRESTPNGRSLPVIRPAPRSRSAVSCGSATRDWPLPAAAICFSPCVDLSEAGALHRTNVDDDPMLDVELVEQFAQWYAGDADRTHALLSPVFGDLDGLPPMLVMAGTEELLLADARRWGGAGTPSGRRGDAGSVGRHGPHLALFRLVSSGGQGGHSPGRRICPQRHPIEDDRQRRADPVSRKEPNHVPRFRADDLRRFTAALLVDAGVVGDDADEVAASLVDANLCGHDSHGVVRIPSYLEQIASGELQSGVPLAVEHESAAMVACDAGFGFGQVQMKRLAERVVKLANQTGVACGTARNCGHIGRLGEYTERIAEAGGARVVVGQRQRRISLRRSARRHGSTGQHQPNFASGTTGRRAAGVRRLDQRGCPGEGDGAAVGR